MISTTWDRTARSRRYQLAGRHARQFAGRTDDDVRDLAEVVALTFRPGDRTETFYNKLVRPLGAAVGVALTYDEAGHKIHLTGVRGEDDRHGFVRYGRDGRREFQYDARQPLSAGAHNRLPAARNPTLVDLAVRMDKACRHRATGAQTPQLPRILLGFAPDDLPPYEPSEALRRRAAHRLGIGVRRLNANPPLLIDRLLRQAWEELTSVPPDPDCGLVLLDSEVSPETSRPLRVFEDFRDLVGDWTWNPVRGFGVPQFSNPSREILRRHRINLQSGDTISQEQVEAALREMHDAVHGLAATLDNEDLLDALAMPDEPLFGTTASLPELRKQMTDYWSACVLDRDLRQAVRRPQEPLFAAGACRIQVFRRSAIGGLRYSSEELRRRCELNLEPVVWQPRHTATANMCLEVT